MLKVRCFHLVQFTMNFVLTLLLSVYCILTVIDFHFGRLVLEIIATLVKSSEICFFYSSAHFLTIIFIVMDRPHVIVALCVLFSMLSLLITGLFQATQQCQRGI